MNSLAGEIQDIATRGNLSLVKVAVGKTMITAIVIDTPETAGYLKVGNPIQVLFKETEVFIGLGQDIPISLQNRLAGKVQSLHTGELLSKLVIETEVGPVTSVITTNAVKTLSLEAGTPVTAMIKTNEIMLAQ